MNSDAFSDIQAFEPLCLSLEDVGPFRNKPYTVEFTDAKGGSCNLFLLRSQNGQGKTTLLEVMSKLMNFVFQANKFDYDNFGHEDIDYKTGRVQWDVRLEFLVHGRKKCVILSLIAGFYGDGRHYLKPWPESLLHEYGATEWHVMGYYRESIWGSPVWKPLAYSNDFVPSLLQLLQMAETLSLNWEKLKLLPTADSLPDMDSITQNANFLPRVLYFTTYRDIQPIPDAEDRAIVRPENWGYTPVYAISGQGDQWTQSLDNLLVWLKWLDDGRFETTVELINKQVFESTDKYLEGVRRDPPEAIVNNSGHRHRLDQLSSGEKSLVQLFLRISAHMTRNTLILIDELDVHLHPEWQHRILGLLKDLVRHYPGTTVIATTHSKEILEAVSPDKSEAGLRQGSCAIIL